MPLKLRVIGRNQTEVEVGPYTILFSYSTPVAVHQEGYGYIKTNKFHSKTTSRHINKWLGTVEAKEVPQSQIDNLIDRTRNQ